jgi:O-antigen/teichoic acid export membrane protein
MSILKKLAGDSVLYGIPSILGRLLNWLLVIIHTRVFEEQAALAENGQLYAWLIPMQIIFTFGMETAFFRYGSKKENQSETFNGVLSFILILGGVFTLFIIAFAPQLSEFLNLRHAENMIRMLAIILWVDALTAIAFVKLRAQQKAKKFAAIKMGNILINIGLNLFFLVLCHATLTKGFFPAFRGAASVLYNPANGPDYIIWANYIASVLTIMMLWQEFKDFKFKWDWTDLKPKLVYAYPLVIMGLAGALNLTADRLMLREYLPEGFYAHYSSTDQAFSVYTQVYKLSIFMTLIVQAYRYAADPLFFSKMGDKSSPNLMAFSTEWFTIACILLWLVVSLNLDWIIMLLGKNYRAELYLVPILLLANLFIGLYGNVSIWFKLSDKTHFGTYITIAAMVLTFTLNYVFIPKYGFLACAVTFALSSFFMVLSAYILGKKHYPVGYDVLSILGYLIAAGIIIGVLYSFDFKDFWPSFLYKNLICALFAAAIIWHQFKIKKVNFRQKF